LGLHFYDFSTIFNGILKLQRKPKTTFTLRPLDSFFDITEIPLVYGNNPRRIAIKAM
jgi:hypothetical protein